MATIARVTSRRYSEFARRNGTKQPEFLANWRRHIPVKQCCHYNLACCMACQEKHEQAIAALSDAVAAGWSNRKHAEDDGGSENASVIATNSRHCCERWTRRLVNCSTSSQRSRFAGTTAGTNAGKRQTMAVSGICSRRCWLSPAVGERPIAEAIESLRRSAAADGSRPEGTVYYMANNNVRSKTREHEFRSAAASLKRLGRKAVIERGILPRDKHDVAGAMVGTASFDWKSSESKILPGAICEHLTSFGGVMRANAGQTPLTEFIRHGAAGASGTVTEPLAIAAKFPSAFLHVHYARGCSLAEAFYQSVFGPYQLLIVGDPLCQPWAKRFTVAASGIGDGKDFDGVVAIAPTLENVPDLRRVVRRFELYIDGRLVDTCQPTEKLELDTTTLADGYHEARVVAVDSTPIETQSRLIAPIVVNNRGRRSTIRPPTEKRIQSDDRLRLQVAAEGAASITIGHNGRELASIQKDAGEIEVSPRELGQGFVLLQAVAKIDGMDVRSRPVGIEVVPNEPPPKPNR